MASGLYINNNTFQYTKNFTGVTSSAAGDISPDWALLTGAGGDAGTMVADGTLGVKLTTATNANGDFCILLPTGADGTSNTKSILGATDGSKVGTFLLTDEQPIFEAVLRTNSGSVLADNNIVMGLTNKIPQNGGTVSAQAGKGQYKNSDIGHGVMVWYVQGVNSSYFNCRVISTLGTYDITGISPAAVATTTSYVVTITIDSNRYARVYIDGVLVHTSSFPLATAIGLLPWVSVVAQTVASGAGVIGVRKVYVQKTYAS